MDITLRELTSLDTAAQFEILAIRNTKSVREVMYTDHEIGTNEHLGWISRLKKDDRQIVFAVLDGEKPLGVASVNAIDRLHRKADWAFYLHESCRGGLGAALELAIIEFVFGPLQLEKLNCEVIEGNDTVVKLHKKFGFVEEGFRPANIIKNEKRIGVYYLGLEKEKWSPKTVIASYSSVFDKFNIRIEWDPKEASLLDQIEGARAKNNVNWMSILRLATEKSPEEATAIISEIQKLDKEIVDMTHKLVNG
ncbi:UDP-4-amino-4,6-dideoxy-N-acetyl-beta-L-altrosamine N-acetyltransferase [Herbaspirillum chlorophenolicum]|uniref:UDP-4-amino-4, 6-dideoxy-N-acetyl-beta-L-altrosamine N-acetyltransferase n=1 Tax=Herbaspirillum chlorophenolicum TaxID=211589 RepID=A0ABW8EV52_9BURK